MPEPAYALTYDRHLQAWSLRLTLGDAWGAWHGTPQELRAWGAAWCLEHRASFAGVAEQLAMAQEVAADRAALLGELQAELADDPEGFVRVRLPRTAQRLRRDLRAEGVTRG